MDMDLKSIGDTLGNSEQWRIQDFPEEVVNSKSGCANLLFCNFFAKNCMKMKKFGPGGGARPWYPLDPPMLNTPIVT